MLVETIELKRGELLNYDYYIEEMTKEIKKSGEHVDWVMDWTNYNIEWMASYGDH